MINKNIKIKITDNDNYNLTYNDGNLKILIFSEKNNQEIATEIQEIIDELQKINSELFADLLID